MKREQTAASLHQRILGALERGARAQEDSHVLVERHAEISRAVRETVELVHRRRGAQGPASASSGQERS